MMNALALMVSIRLLTRPSAFLIRIPIRVLDYFWGHDDECDESLSVRSTALALMVRHLLFYWNSNQNS